MPVAGIPPGAGHRGSQGTVAAEKAHFYPVAVGKIIVLPLVGGAVLIVARFKEFLHKAGEQRQKIIPLIPCLRDPGEVIDAEASV